MTIGDELWSCEMSRRDSVKLSGLVLGGLALGSTTALASDLIALAGIPAQGLGTGVDYWAPYVTKLGQHFATVNWRQPDAGVGSIQYATLRHFSKHRTFNRITRSHVHAQYQHVRLTELEPNASYVYRVTPSGTAGPFGIRAFRTMPGRGQFTFIVLCDSQAGSKYEETKRFKYVADAIAKEKNVLFLLHGGDIARFDDESKWTEFFQLADGMLAKFPIFTTIGNHEYHDRADQSGPPTAAVQYHSAFSVPLHYSFDCCGIRFISLNTPDPRIANGDDPQTSLALAQSQTPWLRAQLRGHNSGVFTIQHHPNWGYGRTGVNPNLQPWETLYHTYPIAASFAGHIHNYERIHVGGIPYLVLGTAGGPCEDIDPTKPAPAGYRFGETRKLGYLKVTVNPAKNTATARQITVGQVTGDDDNETPLIYSSPRVDDSFTFRLHAPRRRHRGR